MKEKSKSLKKDEVPPGTSSGEKSEIWKDPRFLHLVNDPRFKQLPQSQRKVKIDKRFESMFKDDKFKVKYSLDKYGRKSDKTSSEDLKNYYELSSDEDDESNDIENVGKGVLSVKESVEKDMETIRRTDEYGNDILDTDDEIDEDMKSKLHDDMIDYARGYGVTLSDSSSGDESSDEEDDELFIEHVWGELDRDAPKTDESTRRLAACNMDWDRLRAVDIMVLCNSFLPSSGTILSVTIYPSEFGKERMAEEEIKGPQELRELKAFEDDEVDDAVHKEEDAEESEFQMEKLRQYQLNRLKYFYAVIECDSVSTADKLYKECDGMEYESTATKMDLRFIPDDVSFDNDEPHSICKELPDMSKYQPRIFTTTALQQAKVELTWDETAVDRKELNEKLATGKLSDVTDAELRNYIAYSSEEDSDTENAEKNIDDEKDDGDDDDEAEEGGDSIAKYKKLLFDIKTQEEEKKKSQIEREFTWGIGAEEKLNKSKTSKAKALELTPFEKIVEKKKAKQKSRKVERKKKIGKLKGGSDDENSEDTEDSEDDLPDGIDMNDPYFAEEFRNGEFEETKKSTKPKNQKSNVTETDSDEERRNAELALLVEDDDDNQKAHFSLKKIMDGENEPKSKRKRKKLLKKSKSEIARAQVEDNFQVNLNDKRFSAVYSSHEFNIDPTHSHFKKTKGMEKIIDEKFKRRRENCPEDDGTSQINTAENVQPKRKKKDVAMNMLVKSIKRKVASGN